MPGASGTARRLASKVTLALRGVADLGPSVSGAIVASTVRRAAGDRRDRRIDDEPAVARSCGPMISAEPLLVGTGPVGLACHFTEGDLEVRFLADDLVRVTWGPDEPPLPWALAEPAAEHRPTSAVEVVTTEGVLTRTGALEVAVSSDGSLTFALGDGTVVRRELPPLRRGTTRTARALLRRGERVAGLGEQAGPVDLRGSAHRLWNRDPGGAWGPGQDPLYLPVPVTVGLHPDGCVLAFFENTYEAQVHMGAAGPAAEEPRTEITFAGGMLRHYVAAGPLPRLLERYSWLTGRPPLPPRWALGYHQSKWGYKSEADVREVAGGFAHEQLPLSAVHLDIDYMDGYRVFTVDTTRFGDLAGLAADLGSDGTRVVTIVDPGVKADEGYEVFCQGRDEGRFLCDHDGAPHLGVVWPGRAAFPDFTDPATRRWWGSWYKELLDQGVAGVWHDMNEPTSITLWGDRTLSRAVHHDAEGRGADHRECHNVYGLLMDQSGFEALAAHRPGRRPWVLTRSGWAGVQRWAWTWTGDVESTWAGLRQQVATAIGLGLSGVPYTGSDTGGFSGTPGPELFVRWLEMAVLMPFCRTHSVVGSPPREPWRWPDPYRAGIGRLIRLRYRLLPYLYTLAHEASRTGHPFIRPLCWPDGRSGVAPGVDGHLWSDDAYLLGDALLVAPATREGAVTRSVPLPAGDWYRWRALPPLTPDVSDNALSGGDLVRGDLVERLTGGCTVELDTPLGQPVIAVRAGTVLPLDDAWADGDGLGSSGLTPGHEPGLQAVHCFAGPDGGAAGGAYDDAGDGYGPGRVDRYRLTTGARGPVLSWARDGAYRPPERLSVVVHGLTATGASADGRPVPVVQRRGFGGQVATCVECGVFDELSFEL